MELNYQALAAIDWSQLSLFFFMIFIFGLTGYELIKNMNNPKIKSYSSREEIEKDYPNFWW
jgi:hypothetical protein